MTGALGLTSVNALCPWSRHINPSLVLVQPRQTRPFIIERLLMGHKESNQTNKQKGSKVWRVNCVAGDMEIWIKFIYNNGYILPLFSSTSRHEQRGWTGGTPFPVPSPFSPTSFPLLPHFLPLLPPFPPPIRFFPPPDKILFLFKN